MIYFLLFFRAIRQPLQAGCCPARSERVEAARKSPIPHAGELFRGSIYRNAIFLDLLPLARQISERDANVDLGERDHFPRHRLVEESVRYRFLIDPSLLEFGRKESLAPRYLPSIESIDEDAMGRPRAGGVDHTATEFPARP